MDRKEKRHSGHRTDELSTTSLFRKIIKTGVYNKEILRPATAALIALLMLLWLDEIFNPPGGRGFNSPPLGAFNAF